MNRNEKKLHKWLKTSEGKIARNYCKTLNLKNKKIYKGCLEDMMITKDMKIAKESAIAAEEFLNKDKISSSRRFCQASGDPHFTNYDGAYFHLQEPGVYTLAKTHNFEVQEKMRKNGANRAGVPSCMTGVSVKYKDTFIEVDVKGYHQIRVNGEVKSLPRDSTQSYGELKVRFGRQKVEWKGERSSSHGLKITSGNGFGVMVFGGYCGVVEVNAPESYFGKMNGICGNADGSRDHNDFKGPDGRVMNVRYGARRWEMSGYGGPSAPLSIWQLAWKPTGPDCYFKEGCEADSPAVARARATEAERIRKAEEEERKAEEAALRAIHEAKRLEEQKRFEDAKKKEEEARKRIEDARRARDEAERKEREARRIEQERINAEAIKHAREEASKAEQKSNIHKEKSSHSLSPSATESKPISLSESIFNDLKSNHKLSQKKLEKIRRKIIKILKDEKKKEVGELKESLSTLTDSKKEVDSIYKKYLHRINVIKTIKLKIETLKALSKQHFQQMNHDSSYLKKLRIIKPKFLRTLQRYNRQVRIVRDTITKNIIEGSDKDAMIDLIKQADGHTQDSTGKLSKAFLEHYEKYKKLFREKKKQYRDDMSKLTAETDILTQAEKEEKSIKNEYDRARKILNKIKKTYKLTGEQKHDFDILARVINTIFKNPRRVNQYLNGDVDNKCATTLLQSHVVNRLI